MSTKNSVVLNDLITNKYASKRQSKYSKWTSFDVMRALVHLSRDALPSSFG